MTSPQPSDPPKDWRPLPAWVAVIVAVAVAVGSIGIYFWLSDAVSGKGDATQRVEILRTAVPAAGGLGAVSLLWLAFRRQRHHEQYTNKDLAHREEVAIATIEDAQQRRSMELSTQALVQLESDRAATRIAGFNTLERLADLHPEFEPFVLDQICAYLRMPFDFLSEHHLPPDLDRRLAEAPSQDPAALPELELMSNKDKEEWQVRRAAQRILQNHLRKGSDQYWEHSKLDLTGANLDCPNFSGCHLDEAVFANATLYGIITFRGTTFGGTTDFSNTKFIGGRYEFDDVKFNAMTQREAEWYQRIFTEAGPDGPVLPEARGSVHFGQAKFIGGGIFNQVTFHSRASFEGAKFFEPAVFRNCKARIKIKFADVFPHAWPEGWGLGQPTDNMREYAHLTHVEQ